MIPEYFATVGAVVNIVGSLAYAWATLRGKTKPNRVTWLLWSLAPTVAFMTEINDGKSLWVAITTLSAGLGPFMVLLASFTNKSAYWKATTFDYICGAASVVAFGFFMSWKVGGAGSSLAALSLSILADVLAGLPTIVKSYLRPQTEHYSAYLLGAIGMGMTLLAIQDWNFLNYGFPATILVSNTVIFVFIYYKLGNTIHAKIVKPLIAKHK